MPHRPVLSRTLPLLLASLPVTTVLRAGPPVQPKALEFPSRDSARIFTGKMVAADYIHRSGQFRVAGTGELMDFRLLPYGSVIYRGAEADLRDVPLGTTFAFFLHQDLEGNFTRLARMEDRSSDAAKLATAEQKKKFVEFIKRRGLPGWIEKTEGNKLTITFFSGDPQTFNELWAADFDKGKEVRVCVANDELRTWNPPVDGERGSIVDVQKAPTDCYGCSGLRITATVSNMLEGFRHGRVVRVFGPGWKAQDEPYGESLMGYGFGKMQNQELIENVAKEYPEQFPFRTDYSNARLPWYRVQPGQMPPPFAEHLVLGELVSVDPAAKMGRFRAERTGEMIDFALLPEGEVKYLNAKASLADLPLGSRCRFSMFHDEKGAFTRASLVTDEFTRLASNAITHRIEALNLADGKLVVAQQLPLVKDYNGDMQRPPDIGHCELRVSEATRVWKGDQPAKLSDLAVGDVLLVNLTSEQKGTPSRCSDIWVGEETHKLVMEHQSKRLSSLVKASAPPSSPSTPKVFSPEVTNLLKAMVQSDLDKAIAKATDPALKQALSESSTELANAVERMQHVLIVIKVVESARGKVERINTTPEAIAKSAGGPLAIFDTLKLVDLAIPNAGPHDKREVDPCDAGFFEHLGHIDTLESLNIIATKFNDDWIAPLARLTNLKTLRFTNNGKLTDAGLEKLAGLKNLESFSFVGTSMQGHAFAKFDGWTKLTKCSFRGSSIDDEGLKQLCEHFPNLESISLAHAKFTDAGAPALAKLTKLKGLELGTPNATATSLKSTVGLPLEYLQLGEGYEGSENLAVIKPLATLKRLTLTNCGKLDDAGLKLAAKLTQLEQIEFGGLDLPDERLQQLQAFSFLKELKLIRRPQSYAPETQAKIKALLPKVEVKFQ